MSQHYGTQFGGAFFDVKIFEIGAEECASGEGYAAFEKTTARVVIRVFHDQVVGLCKNIFDDFSVYVGQAITPSLVFKGKLFVVNSQEVQHGGLEIVNMYRVFGDVVAEIIGGSVNHTFLHACSGHPDGETTGMMIAAKVVFGQPTL
jgi:hypothetical protein